MDKFEQIENQIEHKPEEPRSTESWFSRTISSVFDFIKTVVVIVLLAFVIRMFVLQPFIVEGTSMEPTFHDSDYLITEKLSYRLRAPQRGDVVIFHPPDTPSVNYIKRIIGLPGETVEIKDGNVYINGKQLAEKYLKGIQPILSEQENMTTRVANNEYYVMGDNRDHSRDSREIGPVAKSFVVSRIWFRLLPVDQIKAFAKVDYSFSSN